VVSRFAVVGVANTLIDVTLFLLLHDHLGVFWANFVSTGTGMAFSFLVNGRYTFGAERVTARQLFWFLLTNAVTMWLLQPVVITGMTRLGHSVLGSSELVVPIAKLIAIGCSIAANFFSYHWVVWGDRLDGVTGEGRRT
jgi:putative flippase GtrA